MAPALYFKSSEVIRLLLCDNQTKFELFIQNYDIRPITTWYVGKTV